MTSSTWFSKRTTILLLAASAIIIASLTVYGLLINFKGDQSIKAHQTVNSYSFRSNRTILVHLKNGYVFRLDLTSVPLNVKVGTKNTLYRAPGSISKYASSGKISGYLLTLTPSAYQAFNKDLVNHFGAASMLQQNLQNHSELVSVSI
ncbi:hypothetical protein ACFP7A_14185 [Sporolactobacillus kofuensis]|uniref:Uncharacterized protein n=1 Tax=Sporolactobacillus kofuensis TaxID=269672 RepID=A0ABW1WGK6_9BACL|nr:hypothetical protein [Sporolactobacillus kofuensis]MCO7177186.1 hypothetical protein [Sporolactobacillus kofuensis]